MDQCIGVGRKDCGVRLEPEGPDPLSLPPRREKGDDALLLTHSFGADQNVFGGGLRDYK